MTSPVLSFSYSRSFALVTATPVPPFHTFPCLSQIRLLAPFPREPVSTSLYQGRTGSPILPAQRIDNRLVSFRISSCSIVQTWAPSQVVTDSGSFLLSPISGSLSLVFAFGQVMTHSSAFHGPGAGEGLPTSS